MDSDACAPRPRAGSGPLLTASHQCSQVARPCCSLLRSTKCSALQRKLAGRCAHSSYSSLLKCYGTGATPRADQFGTFTDVCRMLLPKWSPPLDFREASFLDKALASKLARDVVTIELCQVRQTAMTAGLLLAATAPNCSGRAVAVHQCPPSFLTPAPALLFLPVQAQQSDPTCADGSSALRFVDGRARLQADLSYERIGALLGKVQAKVRSPGGAR